MEHNKIYVGSLSSETTKVQLQELFSVFGPINEINLIKDRYTGESKGFAFIKYSSNSSASKAIEMNGTEIDERTIRVCFAKKKESFKGSGSVRKW